MNVQLRYIVCVITILFSMVILLILLICFITWIPCMDTDVTSLFEPNFISKVTLLNVLFVCLRYVSHLI